MTRTSSFLTNWATFNTKSDFSTHYFAAGASFPSFLVFLLDVATSPGEDGSGHCVTCLSLMTLGPVHTRLRFVDPL